MVLDRIEQIMVINFGFLLIKIHRVIIIYQFGQSIGVGALKVMLNYMFIFIMILFQGSRVI